MAIVTLTSGESGANSLIAINANFVDLDTTKADLASPTFTGTPVLPTGTTGVTQSASDNSTKLATTAYVDVAAQPTQFPTTEIFSGASPTSMTDLDLSSVVGTQSRIVLLKVQITGGGNDLTYYFRKNGETDNQPVTVCSGVSSTGVLAVATTRFAYVIVPTDSAGIVEWVSYTGGSGTSGTTVIDVEAYW